MDSSDFQSDANAASVSETIVVFGKESDASAGLEAIPALIDCAVQAINDGKLNSNGVEFSGTSSKAISLDARILVMDEPTAALTSQETERLFQLIDELKRADVIVLGLPMYNFGLPSTLKAYFDHVARAGITFRYTEEGPVGLVTRKKVYVFAARGGLYAGTPRDTQTQYVRDFLAFLGMNDVEFVYAEGLAVNETAKHHGIARANAHIDRLVRPEAAVA